MTKMEIVHSYLRERGVGFVFLSKEIPWASVGLSVDSASAPLWHLFQEGRIERENTNAGGRPVWRYTTTPLILETRPPRNAPKPYKRNCESTHHKGRTPNAAAPRSASQVMQEIFSLFVELEGMVNHPLEKFTNAQLIAELHRRSGAEALVTGKGQE